jgi:hypothetical protein
MEIQRLNVSTKDMYDRVQKYFQILSVLNDLGLAKGEINLIAFAAIHGNISDKEVREEFCEKYTTTKATINNIVDKLKKKNILHKDGRRIFVNPALTKLPFEESYALVITINKVTL